eukprot:NODE_4_length_55019_cov_0.425091.p20 type:complete len:293 gc:universal NODE_4_length_55019_cov_0.425091:6633-7511(+)
MELEFDQCCTLIKKLLTKSSTLYQYLDLVNQQNQTFLLNGYILQYNTIKYCLSKIKEEVEEELALDYTPLDEYLESRMCSIPDRPMNTSRKLVLKGINECMEENKDSCNVIANRLVESLTGDTSYILVAGDVEHYFRVIDKSLIENHLFICLDMDQAHALGKYGLKVLFILESHLFSIMPKIDKVLLNIHLLLSSTSIVAKTGTSNICSIAKYFRIPVIATVPNQAISSQHAEQLIDVKQLQLPRPVKANGIKSQYDIIPIDHVDILVTSQGIYSSTYAYQLTREFARGFEV